MTNILLTASYYLAIGVVILGLLVLVDSALDRQGRSGR